MTPEEKNQLQELLRWKKQLESANTVPLLVNQALSARILGPANKLASAYNQAVNEGGAASYNVLKAPDGFKQITVGSATFFIPFFK